MIPAGLYSVLHQASKQSPTAWWTNRAKAKHLRDRWQAAGHALTHFIRPFTSSRWHLLVQVLVAMCLGISHGANDISKVVQALTTSESPCMMLVCQRLFGSAGAGCGVPGHLTRRQRHREGHTAPHVSLASIRHLHDRCQGRLTGSPHARKPFQDASFRGCLLVQVVVAVCLGISYGANDVGKGHTTPVVKLASIQYLHDG